MLEFLQEPVTTELQRRPDGSEWPLAFHWRGQRYEIETWGRESTGTRKGRVLHCYLVQTPGPETWELCYDKATAQWTLTRHWANQPPVV